MRRVYTTYANHLVTSHHIISFITHHLTTSAAQTSAPALASYTNKPANRSPTTSKSALLHTQSRERTTYLFINLRPPPRKPLHPPRPHNPEKHNHNPDRKSGIQRRTQRHRVLCPPRPMAPSNAVVEDPTHQRPHAEIKSRGWRYPT